VKYSDKQLMNAIASGKSEERNNAFNFLYKKLTGSVKSLVIRSGGNIYDAEEVLQEAIVSFWEKMVKSVINEERKMNVLGYLTQSCKYIWYKKREEDGRFTNLEIVPEKPEFPYDVYDTDELSAEFKAILGRIIDKVSKRCKELFKYFYFYKWPMDEIAEYLGYSNANSTKNQKYKCIKEAKKIAKQLGLF